MRPRPEKNPDWSVISNENYKKKKGNNDNNDSDSNQNFKKETPKWIEIMEDSIKEAMPFMPNCLSEKGKFFRVYFRTYPEMDKLATAIKEKIPGFYSTKSEVHRKAHYLGMHLLSKMHDLGVTNPLILWLIEHEEELEASEHVEKIIETICNVLDRVSGQNLSRSKAIELIEDLLIKATTCNTEGQKNAKNEQKNVKNTSNVTLNIQAVLHNNQKLDDLLLKLMNEKELKKIKTKLRVRRHRQNRKIKKIKCNKV